MSESIQYWATTNAGNANSDPAISSSDTQAPNTVATNIRSIMTALAKARLDIFGGGLTAGGTPNALTVTTNQVLVSAQLTSGAALMIKAASTNTSTGVTFAPDGLTPAPIKRADGSALAVGSIQAGMFLFLVYNSGTSEWWAANIDPAATLNAGVSPLSIAPSTVASVSAYNSGAQSIASGSLIKLTFPSTEWNVGGYYNAGTSRWTPPAGTVQINAEVVIFAGGVALLYLFKNGSAYKAGQQYNYQTSTSGTIALNSSWQAQANGTDYFEIYVEQTSGSNQNTQGGSANVYFQGSMI